MGSIIKGPWLSYYMYVILQNGICISAQQGHRVLGAMIVDHDR